MTGLRHTRQQESAESVRGLLHPRHTMSKVSADAPAIAIENVSSFLASRCNGVHGSRRVRRLLIIDCGRVGPVILLPDSSDALVIAGLNLELLHARIAQRAGRSFYARIFLR